MRWTLLAAVASMVAIAPVLAPSALGQAATMPAAAASYLEAASSISAFQIQAGQLALQVSRNPAMQSYARMMVDDHGQMLAELTDAAQRSGISMPPQSLLPHHQQMLDQLRMSPPGQFDAVYRKFELGAQSEAVSLYRNFATSGDTPMIQDVADRWWPCMQANQEALPMIYPGERG